MRSLLLATSLSLLFLNSFAQSLADSKDFGQRVVRLLISGDTTKLESVFANRESFINEYENDLDSSEYDSSYQKIALRFSQEFLQTRKSGIKDGIDWGSVVFVKIDRTLGYLTTFDLFFRCQNQNFLINLSDCIYYKHKWWLLGDMEYKGSTIVYSDEELQPLVDQFCYCGKKYLDKDIDNTVIQNCYYDLITSGEKDNSKIIASSQFLSRCEEQCPDAYYAAMTPEPPNNSDGGSLKSLNYAESNLDVNTDIGKKIGDKLFHVIRSKKTGISSEIFVSKQEVSDLMDRIKKSYPSANQPNMDTFWEELSTNLSNEINDIYKGAEAAKINVKKLKVAKVMSKTETKNMIKVTEGLLFLSTKNKTYKVYFSAVYFSSWKVGEVKWIGDTEKNE